MGYDNSIDNSPIHRVVAVDASGQPLYTNSLLVAPVQLNFGTPSATYGTSTKAMEINTTGTTAVDGSGYGATPLVLLSKANTFGGALFAQNQSNGGSASTDIVLFNDTGTPFSQYIDIGINSSTFNDPNFTINGPNQPYVLGNGANMSMGTGTAHDVFWHTGGTLAANEKMRLKNAGNLILNSLTATPAGGATAAFLQFGTTAGLGIYFGSGAPTVSAAQGSLYIRTDGSSTATRMYINTNGSTTWTNVVTAA